MTAVMSTHREAPCSYWAASDHGPVVVEDLQGLRNRAWAVVGYPTVVASVLAYLSA